MEINTPHRRGLPLVANPLLQDQLQDVVEHWIRLGMARLGKKQGELATLAGIHETTLSNILRHERDIDRDTLKKLAAVIGEPPMIAPTSAATGLVARDVYDIIKQLTKIAVQLDEADRVRKAIEEGKASADAAEQLRRDALELGQVPPAEGKSKKRRGGRGKP